MIPVFDLKRQYKGIKEEIFTEINKVLDNTSFILGPSVSEFEENFAAKNGSKYAVGVASGSAALTLAIRALRLPPESEILVPSQTYWATPLAVLNNGFMPIFVDSDPYYGIDIDDANRKVNEFTTAIIPVHLYGNPCGISGIKYLSKKYSLKVIEDCAQAHFATYKEKNVGTFFDMGCYSFYPGKVLGAFGDGGIITTNDESLYKRLKALRNDGRFEGEKYLHHLIGMNERLDSVQASILNVKLKYIDSWIKDRQQIAESYNVLIEEAEIDVEVPKVRPQCTHVYHQYVIKVNNREEVMRKMTSNGIATAIHYPIPCHKQPCLGSINSFDFKCKVAEENASQVLSLPMFPEMTIDEVSQVVNTLKKST